MKKLCLVLAMLVACGCAHAPADQAKQLSPAAKGELSAALVSETIAKGKTTKQEVLAKIGPPNAVARNSRRPSQEASAKEAATAEFWNYWTAPPLGAMAQSGQYPVFRLSIAFDDKGVVLDYQAADTVINVP